MENDMIRYRDLFDRAWNTMRDDLAIFAGLTFVYLLGVSALNMASWVGGLAAGLLHYGYLTCLVKLRNRKVTGESIEFKDFFWPFTDFNRLIHVVLLYVMVVVFIALGLCLLVIPGIYIAVGLSQASIYFVMRKQDAVESIRVSFRQVGQHWWKVFGLCVLVMILNALGVLCLGVGVLISMPVTYLMLIEMFEVLEKEDKAATPSPSISPPLSV
jgi:hypothetical protein